MSILDALKGLAGGPGAGSGNGNPTLDIIGGLIQKSVASAAWFPPCSRAAWVAWSIHG